MIVLVCLPMPIEKTKLFCNERNLMRSNNEIYGLQSIIFRNLWNYDLKCATNDLLLQSHCFSENLHQQ